MSNHGRELAIQIYLTKNLFQTLFARQRITMHVFFHLNMKAIISLHVLIYHERICQATHFGVLLTITTKVLEYAKIAVLQVISTQFDKRLIILLTACFFQFADFHQDQFVMFLEHTIVQHLNVTANQTMKGNCVKDVIGVNFLLCLLKGLMALLIQ